MGRKKVNKHGLSSAEINEFKVMLLEKRNELLGNVNSMESEALRRDRSDLSNMPIHMADLGTDNYEIENIIGLMDSERKMLAEIDEALGRMEDGTYGICLGAGEQIPKQRLAAIPWARYCVNCATNLEKGLIARKADDEYNMTYEDDSQ